MSELVGPSIVRRSAKTTSGADGTDSGEVRTTSLISVTNNVKSHEE